MTRVVAENPAVTEFRQVLATGASEYGQQLIDHDEGDDGLFALARAREQAEAVRRADPNNLSNINALASILRGIGKARAKQGKTAEALDSLRQAVAVSERIAGEDNLSTYDLAWGSPSAAKSPDASSPPRAGTRRSHPGITPTGRWRSCGRPSIAAIGMSIGSNATRNSGRCGPARITGG